MGVLIDLTGKKFGRLTAIKRIDKGSRKSRNAMWLCMCDCGKYAEVSSANLRNGNTQSCGCYRKESETKFNYNDLTGQKFGRLTVIGRSGSTNAKKAMWKCQCDCGGITFATTGDLKSGNTQSCGCYRLERDVEANTTHGGKGTRLYNIWNGIKTRCYNPNNRAYKYYGSRGIKMCEEWKNDYATFNKWAMSNGYADNLTIERKDVNGNYCPENCCWITSIEQGHNKTNSVLITRNGVTKTVSQWANEFGLNFSTIRHRMEKGWSEERLFDPPQNKEN